MNPRTPHLALLTAAATAFLAITAPAGSTAPAETPPAAGESLAQVQLFSPTWYAVVTRLPEKAQMLYTYKDVIVGAQQSARSLRVERVDVDRLVVRASADPRLRSLRVGDSLPGFPRLVFAGTVKLDRLQYQYKQVERITHADPLLVALEGTRAVLEVEVFRSVAPADVPNSPTTRPTGDTGLPGRLRVTEVEPQTYEIAAADLRPFIKNVGEVSLPEFKPILDRFFSYQAGEGWHMASPMADGILDPRGFTVTNPKVARFLGIETGDTVLRINGYPVTSPLAAYWAYQETIARNPLLSELRVDLKRDGALIGRTYRIR